MAANQEESSRNVGAGANATGESGPRVTTIDLAAPAGSKSALGAESVRDGRPATHDEVVEAIDEEGPGIPASPATGSKASRELSH
jgi:hypothetical protein